MHSVPQDPASLDNLNDVVTSSSSAQTMAPGWYVLFVSLAVVVIWVLIKWVRYRLKNQYRVEALQELDLIRIEAKQPKKRDEVVAKLNRLLKRVALAGWNRKQVAIYSGHDWLEFLNRTGGQSRLTEQQMTTIRDSVYSTRIRNSITAELLVDYIDTADQWIRNHRTSGTEIESQQVVDQTGESTP